VSRREAAGWEVEFLSRDSCFIPDGWSGVRNSGSAGRVCSLKLNSVSSMVRQCGPLEYGTRSRSTACPRLHRDIHRPSKQKVGRPIRAAARAPKVHFSGLHVGAGERWRSGMSVRVIKVRGEGGRGRPERKESEAETQSCASIFKPRRLPSPNYRRRRSLLPICDFVLPSLWHICTEREREKERERERDKI